VVKRLFMVKGKKYIQVKEVSIYEREKNTISINSSQLACQVPLDVSSMNQSDCFVLDCGKGKSVLVYTPRGSRKMEKFRAIQVRKNFSHKVWEKNCCLMGIIPITSQPSSRLWPPYLPYPWTKISSEYY
jgi:hypothetical protein